MDSHQYPVGELSMFFQVEWSCRGQSGNYSGCNLSCIGGANSEYRFFVFIQYFPLAVAGRQGGKRKKFIFKKYIWKFSREENLIA